MMHIISRFFVLLVALLSAGQDRALCRDEIATLVPAFSDGDLGMNVGTVLNLKIWRTLLLPPHHSDPDGVVSWDTKTLPDSSYESAEETAKQYGYQLVLWGSIVRVADGVVAQSFLSILMDNIVSKYAPTWSVSVSTREGSTLRLSVTIPRLRYEFPAIVLSGKVLELYSTPSVLKLYEGEDDRPPQIGKSGTPAGVPIGETGDNYRALQYEGDDFILVQPEDEQGAKKGRKGWLYLRGLSGGNEVVDFVGGVIRLLRRDYRHAIESLQKVSKSSSSNTLKIDSMLLQALAKTKLGADASALIDSALEINPYLQITIKYKIISLVSQMKAASGTERKVAVSNLAQQIAENSYLFSPQDDWLDIACKILSTEQRQ